MFRGFAVLALACALGSASVRSAPQDVAQAGDTNSTHSFRSFGPTRKPRDHARHLRYGFCRVMSDPRVIAATRREPEYGKSVGAYIASMASPTRIEMGIRKISQWADILGAVEKTFGVDRWILASIWGVETSYGLAKDRWMSFVRSRHWRGALCHPYFRNELLTALMILQEDHIPATRCSVVGRSHGQPQFMPSSFMAYAVDFPEVGDATSGPMFPTYSPRWPIISASRAGRRIAMGL